MGLLGKSKSKKRSEEFAQGPVVQEELPMPDIPPVIEAGGQDVVLGDQLGCGAFGVVYKARYNDTEVAVKLVRVHNQEQYDLLMREIAVQQTAAKVGAAVPIFYAGQINVQNVLFVLIIMELATGSLDDHIMSVEVVTLHEFYQMCKLMLQAINAVHRQNIIHRDIKPTNFLVMDRRNSGLRGKHGKSKKDLAKKAEDTGAKGQEGVVQVGGEAMMQEATEENFLDVDILLGDFGVSCLDRAPEEEDPRAHFKRQSTRMQQTAYAEKGITADMMRTLHPGDMNYASPRIYMQDYGPDVDIYSFAVSVVELWMKRFSGYDYPPELVNIINRCIAVDLFPTPRSSQLIEEFNGLLAFTKPKNKNCDIM